MALSFLLPTLSISAETVVKLQKYDFGAYNYLTLLHSKLEKRTELGFFDSLAIKHKYHIFKNYCEIVFSQGQIHFAGFAFFDFLRYFSDNS